MATATLQCGHNCLFFQKSGPQEVWPGGGSLSRYPAQLVVHFATRSVRHALLYPKAQTVKYGSGPCCAGFHAWHQACSASSAQHLPVCHMQMRNSIAHMQRCTQKYAQANPHTCTTQCAISKKNLG
eukprot:365089-Chlamydomonas_euryale.AAC.7